MGTARLRGRPPSHISHSASQLEELRAENERLLKENARLRVYEELAYHDDLTGIHNRRYFEQRMAQELSRAERTGKGLALALIDLDDFKRVNDLAGHAVGDRVLRFTGRFLAGCCRSFDIACRIGGDEFALIIPETDTAGASALVERIARGIENAADVPFVRPIAFSYGIALYPTDAHTLDNLLAHADHAMYLHKRDKKSSPGR